MPRSRESVVKVTVSHGVPDMSCCERVSRSLFTCATFNNTYKADQSARVPEATLSYILTNAFPGLRLV